MNAVTKSTVAAAVADTGNSAVLTQQQAEELWELMTAAGTREGAFLAAMAPGLRSITQAPANDFTRLRTALLTRVNARRTP